MRHPSRCTSTPAAAVPATRPAAALVPAAAAAAPAVAAARPAAAPTGAVAAAAAPAALPAALALLIGILALLLAALLGLALHGLALGRGLCWGLILRGRRLGRGRWLCLGRLLGLGRGPGRRGARHRVVLALGAAELACAVTYEAHVLAIGPIPSQMDGRGSERKPAVHAAKARLLEGNAAHAGLPLPNTAQHERPHAKDAPKVES